MLGRPSQPVFGQCLVGLGTGCIAASLITRPDAFCRSEKQIEARHDTHHVGRSGSCRRRGGYCSGHAAGGHPVFLERGDLPSRIALIAAVLGFGGIAGGAVEIAKVVFFVALVLFLIAALTGILRRDTL